MGWWVPRPVTAPGDQILWQVAANREVPPLRQVGGRLFVTQSQLIHQPNRLDAFFSASPWRTNIADVASAQAEAATPLGQHRKIGVNIARLRKRLRVELVTGDVELFVINHVEEVVARLSRVVDRAR